MKAIKYLTAAVLGATLAANASTVDIGNLRHVGSYKISTPYMLDSLGVDGKPFDVESLLDNQPVADTGSKLTGTTQIILDAAGNRAAVDVVTFELENSGFVKGKLNIEGPAKHRVFVDGVKVADNGEITLTPATHTAHVKFLREPGAEADTVSVTFATETPGLIAPAATEGRLITLHDIMGGERIASAALSPSAKYLLTVYSFTERGGHTTYSSRITDADTGKLLLTCPGRQQWMPTTDRLYTVETANGRNTLYSIDPAGGSRKVLAANVPTSALAIAPTEDFAVYVKRNEGPAELDTDLYEVVNPEDRQPGWRTRGQLMRFDFDTALSTPLTFGNRNVWPLGFSDDAATLLFMASETCMGARPTQRMSLYTMDLTDGKVHTLVDRDGFMGGATISPDGRQVAVTGSPEALGGIGRNLPDSLIPSAYDYQLFVMNADGSDIKALTRDFDPAVQDVQWGRDGNIYFTAQNRDRIDLYSANPSTGVITSLEAPEENILRFDVAGKRPSLVYIGQSADNSDRLYSLDLKRSRHTLVDDLSARRLQGIRLGRTVACDYTTSRGDSISARYVLPPDFDPERKYPLIVNYYGGCSPTERTFESRYPHHVYAAHGYVVLSITPRGASGFGQKYAAAHVNTAGQGVADDIIDGVTKFVAEHPWVDATRIGCIGASYGGFMTQYLQTRTPIFAAAISHAGISDHTSYWGEGYWGYSYSEVSMADSYPWSHRNLYVDNSPLYNADKIHTPLLFLHGDSDTNVPVGESIQLYTALKLLNRPTAMVLVKGANHQVLDYNQRLKWQNTIFAWFDRYLKGQPQWWNTLYPPKSLK